MTALNASSVGPPRVVIADDDADIRLLIGLAASKAGVTVAASVGDGEAALQAIRQMRPSLAILDVSMPKLTGPQVCEAVRAEPAIAGIVVLLLSAAVQPSAIEAGMRAGADSYGQKPFSPRKLAEQIRELLAKVEPAR